MLNNEDLTLEQIKDLHDKAYDHNKNTRQQAADDSLFAFVTQWDDTYLSSSNLAYKGEFNILRKAMRQILTDLIANPIQVDFEPVDETDEFLSEVLDGMYRADMRHNSSQEAIKNCSQETVVCGFGAWELRNEYKTSKKGDQRQVVRRTPIYEANNNAFWDPNAKAIDKNDATYLSLLEAYSEDGYQELKKELTGDESKYDCSFAKPETSYVFPWISQDKKIHVVRFFHRYKKKITYYTYEDQFGLEETFPSDELSEREEDLAERGAEFISEKEIERWQVKRYIASGEKILDVQVLPGQHIPVVPQYGERQFVEGEECYEGIVRLAKHPQRLRNFQMSYLADIVSRSPREKPIFTAEQIQGFEDMYEQPGSDNDYPYLKQNSFDAAGNQLDGGPVGYIKAPEIPPALQQSLVETRAAVDDVASAGLPADITDVDLSGKALNALNKRLDMQSYTYQDNNKFAMRRDGEIYASMMADIKDIEEDVTLVKWDGTSTTETINKLDFELTDTGVEKFVTNNMQDAEFDVYADIGPAFESVKAQNKEELKELINGMTPDTPTYTMLLNKYLMLIDGQNFNDVRDYARQQLIMMGVQKPETDEEIAMVQEAQQNQGPSAQEQAMLEAARAESLKGQAQLKDAETKQIEAEVKAFDAETKRMKVQVDAQEVGAKINNINMDTNLKQVDIGKRKAETFSTLRAS